MRPPLFDSMYIAHAVRGEALPALERLAERSSLCDRALDRFDHDDPPPYVSTTEDEEDDMPHPALGPINSAMLEELNHLLDAPLDDDERDRAARHLQNQSHIYEPRVRYAAEAKIERERIHAWAKFEASPDTRDYLVQLGPAKKGRAGHERVNIIARRNIKRRWDKLKVWNPDWEIPGNMNNTKPNDDASKWKWRWQHDNAAAEWRTGLKTMALNPQHPITRALHLREGLHRSEHIPVSPRSRLQDDASASQAESFLISRPWFMYLVEKPEEEERYSRIPWKQKRLYGSTSKYVEERWKENDDWKVDWLDRSGNKLVGWKWRHESPSPEPEDLVGLDDLTTFEFTSSEVDALEAVPPPSPTPEPASLPPCEAGTGLFGIYPPIPPPPTAPSDSGDGLEEAAKQASLPHQGQRRRRRQQRDANSAQPLRRNARIAAMTVNQPPPLPSPQQQQRQPRRWATRPALARPPVAERPKRGRPRKAGDLGGVSKPLTRAKVGRESNRRKGTRKHNKTVGQARRTTLTMAE